MKTEMKKHLSMDELLETDFDCEIDDLDQAKVNQNWIYHPSTNVAVATGGSWIA
ncbi:MAG: hypothetical protein ACERKZ_03810 [Lachnotalea sp.]